MTSAQGIADGRAFLSERLPSCALPHRLGIVSEIPKTSVSKLDKKVLRTQLSS